MKLSEKFLELSAVGSEWILWILVGLSVVSVAVMIERLIFYSGVQGRDTALVRALHAALADRDIAKAQEVLRAATSPGARIAAQMLETSQRGAASMAAIMAALRPGEKLRLERNLNFLGTVGSNSPFIGLLGTVLGIIETFRAIERSGVMGSAEYSNAVMAGIYEALVATAVGLLVAIPAVIAFNFFQRRVKALLGEADALTNMVLSLSSNQDGATRPH
ncbi:MULTISPECIES: MotA/TolQ/ExbB proton channel family protein [Nannocystis]|uniref:MotA/TolQ/ExbB proton channel family protein n=1 Tax=Nannocystis radixulma TaxID=2995305 RepID=A0ABT5B604_9BACT|nr:MULTISPECIES: MotA/TolQ/ExbB proton channel family protein [Nannocystis]MCY1056036.1 MotA/TolQ/ExbB proton channel family protein [Nannocystis sp. SCPEA4]MDC0668888.1 MotA/TolQ/ExbB proton channel family protein [Nannocystis radixulma]